METGKFVYLSGDVFNDDLKINFTLAQNFLEGLGYIVINPTRLGEIADSLTEDQIMQIRYRLVDLSHVIFMVSGWQKNRDAKSELTYAKSLNKEIMYQDYFAPFRKIGGNDESVEDNIE